MSAEKFAGSLHHMNCIKKS